MREDRAGDGAGRRRIGHALLQAQHVGSRSCITRPGCRWPRAPGADRRRSRWSARRRSAIALVGAAGVGLDHRRGRRRREGWRRAPARPAAPGPAASAARRRSSATASIALSTVMSPTITTSIGAGRQRRRRRAPSARRRSRPPISARIGKVQRRSPACSKPPRSRTSTPCRWPRTGPPASGRGLHPLERLRPPARIGHVGRQHLQLGGERRWCGCAPASTKASSLGAEVHAVDLAGQRALGVVGADLPQAAFGEGRCRPR